MRNFPTTSRSGSLFLTLAAFGALCALSCSEKTEGFVSLGSENAGAGSAGGAAATNTGTDSGGASTTVGFASGGASAIGGTAATGGASTVTVTSPAPLQFCPEPTCADGTKLCNSVCVAPGDPRTGCSATACEPCATAHAVAKCQADACAIAACDAGWADCDGNPANGCEADLSSPATCGSCNVICDTANPLCSASGCVAACEPPATPCGSRCVNLYSSSFACGGCSTPCTGNATCTSGVCGITCSTGLQACTDRCIDTATDPNNCGSCGHSCGITGHCVDSQCVSYCAPGFTDCGWRGCILLPADDYSCGACGNFCGQDEVCVRSACVPKTSLAIASGITNVATMVLDGTRLYFTDGTSSVQSVALTGGAVITLAANQEAPTGLAIDDQYVYWSNHLGAAIKRTLKDGTGSPELVAAATMPTTVGVFGDYVYWADDARAAIWRAPKSGGTATDMLQSDGFESLAMTPTGIYYWSSIDWYNKNALSLFDGWVAFIGRYSLFTPVGDYVVRETSPVNGGSYSGPYFTMEFLDPATGNVISTATEASQSGGWLTANSCGLFKIDNGLAIMPMALRNSSGVRTIPLLNKLDGPMGVATSDDKNIYFFAGNSINRLPLP